MKYEDAKLLHQKLSRDLRRFSESYYLFSEPEVSDAEYDALYSQLIELEKKFPELSTPDSPSNTVGSSLKNSPFKKIKHLEPMLSLNNAFSEADMDMFTNSLFEWLRIDSLPEMVLELKLDGLSASIRYEKGRLASAATRGNGRVGENVTENIRYVANIPAVLATDNPPDLIEICGEVIMMKNDFWQLNEQLEDEGESLFSTPRNASAGLLRNTNPEVTKRGNLHFFAYSIVGDNKYAKHLDVLAALRDYGFYVNPMYLVSSNKEEMLKFYEMVAHKRSELDFDIDGVVYKVNSLDFQRRLGNTSKYPRHSIAYKFSAQAAETRIESIVTQVGRTGVVTPVANVEPINIGGVVISRATLHNASEVKAKDIREGDRVLLERAGDVIPKITRVFYESRTGDEKPFIFPGRCPSCSTILVREEKLDCNSEKKEKKKKETFFMKCPNAVGCPAQHLERMKHFVSKKAFDIEGLGEKNLVFLIQNGFIAEPVDIFKLIETGGGQQMNIFNDGLKIDSLKNLTSWNNVSVDNLAKAIEKSKNVTLDRFIYSLGIPYVGKEISGILASYYKTVRNFFSAAETLEFDDLKKIDKVGSTVAEKCSEFFSIEYFRRISFDLVGYPEMTGPVVVSDHVDIRGAKLSGLSFVFTGKLDGMSRYEAKNAIEQLGGKVMSSVSSKTSYLVANSLSSNKRKFAEALNISILTEEEFMKIIKN